MKNRAPWQSKHSVIITLFLSLTLGSLGLWTGCASKNLKNMSQGQIDLAQAKNLQKAGRYEMAIEQYSIIKNKYPLSPEAIEAELELAETFYLQGSYPEARGSFQAFMELHPRHPKVDFAAYRVSMSHFKLIPSTIDRDLKPAERAIQSFDTFINRFPKSPYVTNARAKRTTAKKKLAEKEFYIANFYLKRKQYTAAAGRYRMILKKYRGVGFDEKALFNLGLCYYEQDSKKRAKHTLELFVKRYPKSDQLKEAKGMLNKL